MSRNKYGFAACRVMAMHAEIITVFDTEEGAIAACHSLRSFEGSRDFFVVEARLRSDGEWVGLFGLGGRLGAGDRVAPALEGMGPANSQSSARIANTLSQTSDFRNSDIDIGS